MDTPTKIGPVEFAPLSIPLERRLQTLSALWFSGMTFFFPFFNVFLIYYILFYTNYWWLLVLYAIWYYLDFETPKRGGRPSRIAQDLTTNKWFVDYFPIKLIKTADFDPEKNYLIGYHPHGVISIACLMSFGMFASQILILDPKLQRSCIDIWTHSERHPQSMKVAVRICKKCR